MVQLLTLQRTAIYGAAFTSVCCGLMYVRMQFQMASAEYYRKSIEALKADERLSKALGPPVKPLFLNLANPDNYILPDKVELSIPVRGTLHKGHLHTKCVRNEESGCWVIESLEVEVKNKKVAVKIPKQI